MTHITVDNLKFIENEVILKSEICKIIAVTKTFEMQRIKYLIDFGHIHFGENKVQEAIEKWSDVKNRSKKLKLHMIGKLQRNKVKYAVPLFDYIHSLDNIRLAEKISLEQKKINKNLKIFIQVNIGNEQQKSGIEKENLETFYEKCIKDYQLDIVGLMCIPPTNSDVRFYFNEMKTLNKSLGLKELSMGMSSDYSEALEYGATFIRIGSKIFGERS